VDVAEPMAIGVRTWGNDPEGSTAMLIGAYEHTGEIATPVLSALPPTVVLRAGEWPDQVVALLAAEVARDQPGQTVVLDRLLDLLVVTALRTWFSRDDVDQPAPFRASSDPVVARALALLDQHLDEPWTVASLAREVGVSRASLARRFTTLVGEPPMAYLTTRRLALAADLLVDPTTTVGAVARRVGYGSPYALSTAFRRERGMSPSEHRARHLAPVATG
jgi:transcriptional regulator GlxA family with amidase domain